MRWSRKLCVRHRFRLIDVKSAVVPVAGNDEAAVRDECAAIRPFAVVRGDIRTSLFELVEERRRPVTLEGEISPQPDF
jgi:hypothetical protein